MPELPDVEGLRRYAADHVVGQRIARIEIRDDDVLRNTSPQGLGRALSGERVEAAERHGKWLLLRTSGSTLVLHFGMTGFLTWADDDVGRDDHDHVALVCDDGELRFNLTRKFGGAWLASDERQLTEVTGELGPDATDLGRDDLADLLEGRRGGLKSALMDQELVAGIGNIVADEVLWRSRLHPAVGASDLDGDELDRLHGALTEVLEVSIDAGQVPRRDDWLTHARDVDAPTCPRCGTDVRNTEIASRTTYLCPSCQPAP